MKTGKYVSGDEEVTDSNGRRPDHVFESFAHLVEEFVKQRKSG